MVRILIIDDTPDDRLLAIRELNRAFSDLHVEQITAAAEFEPVLAAGNFDIVITDYRLGWSDGIAILRAIKARYPDIPVVMFTNSGNEEIAVEAMKSGLNDYVLKSYKHYFRLSVAVRSTLEQAQQNRALKAAETRYSELFNRIPVGMYRITPHGEVLEANPALLQLLGYTNLPAIQQVDVIDLHIEAEVKHQWRERMERDSIVRDFETPVRTLDGKVVWVRHSARAIRNSTGEVLYYEGAVEDVTERKQVEEERKTILLREQAARAQAEAANRMKDEFLATLSHELRTPLNSMLGWANLLRNRKLNETTIARALETIERNAKAQNQMIEDLLDVSRIIRGKLRLTVCPVNFVSVIEAAIDAVRPTATTKTIALEKLYRLPALELPRQELTIVGDANRLQQVVWNLLTNAIKFTPVGGKVTVRLSVEANKGIRDRGLQVGMREGSRVGAAADLSRLPVGEGDKEMIDSDRLLSLQSPTPSSALGSFACIEVEDTGQGISNDFLPHIFEHFRQADSTSTRSHGGLGLGLAIVRQLVEMHGGTVTAASPGVGQGATFTVRLPLQAQINLAETEEQSKGVGKNSEFRIPNSELPLPTPNLLRPAPITLEGVRVLVVDDEVDAREMLTMVLELYRAKVTTVDSVAAAQSAIATSPPHILVSDIAMPQADGYMLIRALREQGKDIPAIALTAYASNSDHDAAIAAGFQCHISKPVEPKELVAAIAELLASK